MNPEKGFFDKNTLIAIVLMGAIWFGWDAYMSKNYPKTPVVTENAPVTPDTKDTASASDTKSETTETNRSNTGDMKQVSAMANAAPETSLSYEDDLMKFEVSSQGMGLKEIYLKKYTTREKQLVRLDTTKDELPFQTNLTTGEAIPFHLVAKSTNEFVGTYETSDIKVVKTYKVNSSLYSIESTISIEGKNHPLTNIQNIIVDITKPAVGHSILNPSLDRQEVFVHYADTFERKIFNEEKPVQEDWKQVAIASLNTQYFALAIIDKSAAVPTFRTVFDTKSKHTKGVMAYDFSAFNSNKADLEYTIFAGPKKMNILKSIDDRLTNIVDFGFFSVIAKPILTLLLWLYGIFKNYGISIIILTVLMRLLVMPFNVMSYKSMKSMQKIQPHLAAVREKHKKDSTRMNQEVMAIMKEHKVNPLGGCLPMLIQLPVFFALYQVLGQSIELYQAPFAFWIHDLSLKDPYYVLPVLMGITMFLQQKLTPSTMDPAQAKVLAFMPLLFSGLMIALPSGLTLYIFVSTLFAVIQQKILLAKTA